MTDIEFEQAREALASGNMSRRRFVNRLIAGGVTFTAAMAYADSASAAKPASGGSSGALYGVPPGQGGTPPGQGGTPPPFAEPPPGLGGTPPGKGGTPPGKNRPGS